MYLICSPEIVSQRHSEKGRDRTVLQDRGESRHRAEERAGAADVAQPAVVRVAPAP